MSNVIVIIFIAIVGIPLIMKGLPLLVEAVADTLKAIAATSPEASFAMILVLFGVIVWSCLTVARR